MVIRKTLAVELEEDEWKALLALRSLLGADSWNSFFQLLVREPQKFIFNLLGRKDLIEDMKEIVNKIEKGEIKSD
jgi:hypothetical protein